VTVDGSHGTGKTTLVGDLKSHLVGWMMLAEPARAIAEAQGIHTTEDWASLYADPVRHRLFLEQVVARHLTVPATDSISDGSIYRAYAYAEAAGIALDPGPLTRVRYDMILYCPLELKLVADGFRFERDRVEVDQGLRRLIAEHHAGRLVELRGDPGRRLQTALEALDELA
jgi:nicotinamide riboside kinase